MGSTAATFEERDYPVTPLTGRIAMTGQRMSERADRWGEEYLRRSYALIERWAVRAVARRDAVRVGAVIVRDASEESDWFLLDRMGVRWTVKAARGPIPGLRPGAFVPLGDATKVLRVPVLKGAEGWAQGKVEHELMGLDPGLDTVPTTVEVELTLARRVAVRAHMLHGDRESLGRCVEPDCIAIRELLGELLG